MASHLRRNLRPGSTLASFIMILTLATLLLGAVLDASAQQGPQLQANPTDEPEEEIDSFQANPTQEPTREPIDDIVSNPTEEPTREPIDDIVSNPTERPTDEPIDDVVANPTEAPGIDDEAIPTTGTVRVEKRDCPPGVPDDATLSEYLKLCPEAHNGVEFVVNDVNGAQAGVTEGGVVEWTGVDPGVFNITETVPAGYGDPIVFCGYTESPGGGVQHPARMGATGGIVEGAFPDAMFEFVCYWMNVPVDSGFGGPDDITAREDDGTATFLLFKRVCDNDIPPYQNAAYYLDHCTEVVDGIPFTVSHANGDSTKTTTDGEAEWHGIPLGPFMVDEDLPVQFGEPIVFCGWTAIHEGIVYDAFSQQVPAPGGTVELEVTIPGATHFCYYFNVEGIGDFVDPASVANTLVVRKSDCPDGTSTNQRDRDYYFQRCQLMTDPVQFTLSNANGDDAKATQGGFAEWIDLPLGEFTLTETVPEGYSAPVWFCGWYAEWDGFHFDAPPHLVDNAVHNVYEGNITIPNTDYFCDVFNVVGEIDDLVANPTEVPGIDDVQGNVTAGIVRLEKHDCPLGVPTDATLADYLRICTQLHDGVGFSLETSEGVAIGSTAMGDVQWTGVPGGTFEIRETIPAGYTDPIVFCGYTESPGGGVQHPSQQSAAGGVVAGEFPDGIFELVCYWMNIKETSQGIPGADAIASAGGGGISSLRIWNRDCPGVSTEGLSLDVLDGSCSGDLNGVTFEVTHGNGSSGKPIVDGEATWQGLPLTPYTIDEAVPGGYGDPIVNCDITAFGQGDAWLLSAHEFFPTAPDGAIELVFDPPADLEIAEIARMETNCTYYNFPLGPGSFTQEQETTNTFTARKWMCDSDTLPSINKSDMEAQCQLSTFPVELTLTNADGASTQATDPAWTTWENVPLGEFTLQETIPDGYQEPIVFCDWTAFYNGMVYDDFPHIVPSTGGLVEGEITIPNTSYACDLYNIATGPGVGGPDSVTSNPQDESNTLVAHKWFCEEGTTADAHLLDYFEQCQLADTPVEFTLTNDDGESTQATVGGTATWEDVPLGPFTLQETIPAGYEVLVVWCGWTAFYNGAVYDAFSQPVPVQDGLVEGEITVPNTHYRCDFINAPAEIDDIVANPTEVDEIDDVVANPTQEPTEEPIDDLQANPPESAEPWFRADAAVCPAGFDLNVNWMDVFQACTIPIEGVEFTFTDASGSSTQSLTGNFVQWDQVGIGEGQTVELVEDYPAGYTEPYVLCSSWPKEAGDPFDWYYEPVEATGGTISVTPNLDEGDGPLGVIPSGEGYDCHFLHFAAEGIAGADDIQANPTQAPTEAPIDDVVANPTEEPTEAPIDDVVANPAETGTLTVRSWECPPLYDPLAGNALDDCAEVLDGITFDLVNHAEGQPDYQATSGDVIAGAAVFEPQPGTYSLKEQLLAGYGEPFLWQCSGLTGEPLDPPISTINFFRIVIDAGQSIECDWMNVPDGTGFGGPDDIQANPTAEPTEEPIDDLTANPVPYRIIVYPMACSDGVGPQDDHATLSDACNWFDGEVVFTLITESGNIEYLAEYGSADWDDVDLGEDGAVQIHEELPNGYDETTAWCFNLPLDEDAEDFGYYQAPATDGTITVQPDNIWPHTFSCFFYNFPDDSPGQGNGQGQGQGNGQGEGNADSGTVEVRVYDCPADVPLNAAPYSSVWWVTNPDYTSIYDYWELCPDQPEGITLALDHSGGSEVAVTTGEFTLFEAVGLGAFTLAVELPTGYGNPIVYCAFRDEAGMLHPALLPVPEGVVTDAMVAGGDEYFCSWFNIPTGEGADGPDAFTTQHAARSATRSRGTRLVG